MFLSQIFLSLSFVILTTESTTSPLHKTANASADYPDKGFHNIKNKNNALGRTLHNLETTVREKTTLSDPLTRQMLLTVDEKDTKTETNNFKTLSLETKKTPMRNITG